MIRSVGSDRNLGETLDKIGLAAALEGSRSALIKINMARPPEPGHPRTDVALLSGVIHYLAGRKVDCAVAEGANGFLRENLKRAGMRVADSRAQSGASARRVMTVRSLVGIYPAIVNGV